MRVLIVDDSSLMRKVMQRALRGSGVAIDDVLEADNGSDALRLIADQPVDLVIADVHMPVMDGLELAEQMRKLGELRPPLMIVSSETGEQHVLRALDAGADAYLTKPFTPEDLRARMRSLLGVQS